MRKTDSESAHAVKVTCFPEAMTCLLVKLCGIPDEHLDSHGVIGIEILCQGIFIRCAAWRPSKHFRYTEVKH